MLGAAIKGLHLNVKFGSLLQISVKTEVRNGYVPKLRNADSYFEAISQR